MELKELRPLLKHSGQTLRSFGLISELHSNYDQQCCYYLAFQIAGNNIGDEGAKAIAEALKENASLIDLGLRVIQLPPSLILSVVTLSNL